MSQNFPRGFTDVHSDKNISADERTQKQFWSTSSYPIADLKNDISYLLQYIENYRLKLYGA